MQAKQVAHAKQVSHVESDKHKRAGKVLSDLTRVEQYFQARPPMAIAVSGGVDSMTLAVVAHRARPGTQVFHALSPAVPAEATERVRQKARQEGWALKVMDAGEMQDPSYLANPANRCYYCKTNLYGTLTSLTSLQLASGTNLDDLGDYRPGLGAAAEHQVIHPWVELGVSKQGLRGIAAALGLDDLKDLPASPCLSSRVTTGIAIDARLLPIIDEAERLVAGLLEAGQGAPAVQGVRCRIQPTGVAIQLELTQPADATMTATGEMTPGNNEATKLGKAVSIIDPSADWHQQLVGEVGALFASKGYPQKQVRVEPYKKGSAFLVDAMQLQ